ncbi:MAG: EAL domain-containing protein [Psychromonas sp.]|nr:EAL domain-containing protein [Psychromonas sp.]
MHKYRKSLWISNLTILSFAVLITFAIKFTLNPFLLQQQKSLTERLYANEIPLISNFTQLHKIIPDQQFSYIKISNSILLSPLIYENKTLPFLSYLLPIPATTFISKDGKQLIEFKAENARLLAFTTQLLIIIYIALVTISLLLNLFYFRLFKNIERALLQEISDEAPPSSPFVKVSQQLQEQKKLFHRSLQKQEQQILVLARQINRDNLTGINNRHAFREALTDILNKETEHKQAILFVLRASELNAINSQRGYQHGDEYIVNIADILDKTAAKLPAVSVYRISGADFALIARKMNISDARSLARNLKTQFDQYQLLNKLDSVAYCGIATIVSGQLPGQVLARVDMALAKAQTDAVNSWFFEQEECNDTLFGQQHWQEVIEEVISKRALMLLHQPIQAIHHNMRGYQEIFTRFIGDGENMIPTDTIFAMAQRVDMIVQLEQLIIETVASQCRHKTDENSRLGVNITGAAIQNNSFAVWLERLLLREPHIAACLIFEMQEEVLNCNLVASKRIFEMLRRTGTRSTICRFGKGVGSFRLLKELQPDFIKIDASLINNIERDSANQQFVRMIIDIAHRLDCKVIAEGIEHLGQKQILESMYVDGIQGFLIARPSPFSTTVH